MRTLPAIHHYRPGDVVHFNGDRWRVDTGFGYAFWRRLRTWEIQ